MNVEYKKISEQIIEKIIEEYLYGTDLSIRNGKADKFKIIANFSIKGFVDSNGKQIKGQF
jgi:hypothetical protein